MRSIQPVFTISHVNTQQTGLSGAVADVLKGLQNQQRLTQSELSALCGVPVVSLQRYLAGTRSVPIDALEAIARALGTDAQRVVMDAAVLLSRK